MQQLLFFVLGMTAAAFLFCWVEFLCTKAKGGICPHSPSDSPHAYSPHETARNGGKKVCIWCGEPEEPR